jgi:hypothetical protein
MNYVELKNNASELIIRLVFGTIYEETGCLNDEEKESLKEIILDNLELEEDQERFCIITAVFVNENCMSGEISRYSLGGTKISPDNRIQTIMNYLEYRKNRKEIHLWDEDLQAKYKKEVVFWVNYPDKLQKYISVNNIITRFSCIQKFRNCPLQCDKAKENIFSCEYCKCGG